MKHLVLVFFFLLIGFALKAQLSARGGTELSIYPNPAVEYISVADENEQVAEIWVFNLLGKKVKSFEFSKGENYFIGDLPKNMYLVQLIDRNSKIITTQKLQKR